MNANTITMKNWREALISNMRSAARRGGFSIDGIQLETVDVDRTYGDLVGLVVTGLEGDVLGRAVAYAQAWMTKYLSPLHTYRVQVSIGSPLPVTYCAYSNGVGRWYVDGRTVHSTMTPVEVKAGMAIPYAYFPGND